MGFLRILWLLFAIFLSGTMGWFSLFFFFFFKVAQHFVDLEVTGSDDAYDRMIRAVVDAIGNIGGAPVLFLAAAIAGVLLSEIFKSRAFLFYAGATGALTALLASAMWQSPGMGGSAQTTMGLALAGCVTGGCYWLMASPSAPEQ
jgi:hypothetical protein